MTTVAVTGATGFLGRHVIRELRNAGHVVRPFGRNRTGAHLVRLDTEDSAAPLAEQLDGVVAMVHLAGRLSTDPSTSLQQYLEPNVGLTEQVLLAAMTAGVSKFVFSSSRLVYPPDLGRPAIEADRPAPTSNYGLSKLFAEQLCESYTARTGITTLSLRIAQVIGGDTGARGVLATFARAARNGGPIVIAGSGRAVRDFVHVDDVARAIHAAIERTTGVPVVNVGGGSPQTIRELALTAARVAGLPEEKVRHTTSPDDDLSNWSLDISLARRELGWEPEHSLDSMILDVIGHHTS